MTKNTTIVSKSKMRPGPSGMGAKVIQGHMTLVPTREAIQHSDVELNTINALFIEQNTPGSWTVVDVVAPGTYDNYASLTTYNLNGTGGYIAVRTAGTQNVHFMAVGE